MTALRLVAAALPIMLAPYSSAVGAAPQTLRGESAKSVDKRSVTTKRTSHDAPPAPATPNMCLGFTYDQNGNRLTQTTAGFNASSVWGSSTYPCFVWSAT